MYVKVVLTAALDSNESKVRYRKVRGISERMGENETESEFKSVLFCQRRKNGGK